jgi:hypothetical protein
MIAEAILGCLVMGYVNPVVKEITTQTSGCEIEQRIIDGRLYLERTDSKRNVWMSLPASKTAYYFYYTFGEDTVFFSNGTDPRAVSKGQGGV